MKITVNRDPSRAGATVGRLYVDGAFCCYTLEDEVREVPGQPVADWKIKGATAIPAGQYRVSLEQSPRFGPNTLTIHNVPGFVGVRMHAGNTAADTEGCLLLGLRATGAAIVGGTSRPAVALVQSQVARALREGQTVTLDINNPTAQA